MNSAIYIGTVMHRRLEPVKHDFLYNIHMPCIDIDEIDTLSQQSRLLGQKWWNILRFKREDYVGTGDLKSAVQSKIKALTGESIEGRVMLLCQLRCFGIYFSPVNFYYVYDQQDNWRYLLAEVSNTPWNERHYYAVPAGDSWQHDKAFHVSPFNPMDQQYQWQLAPLDELAQLKINVHKQDKVFEAGIKLHRTAISAGLLTKLLIKTPIMPVKILFGIYSHAFKLWLKSAPFYSHPGELNHQTARSQHVQD
jgi:DUF1365 family protein